MSAAWVVRLPTWLGDTLMALPAIRALARLTGSPPLLWGRPAYGDLLRHTDLDFDFLPYPRRRGARGISDAIHACAALRHHEPAGALLLPNSFEPALLTGAALIPRRVGFATDGRGPLLTDVVPQPQPRHRVHEAERFAALVRHLGADVDAPRDARLQLDDTLRARAVEMLPGTDYLGIAPGSANTPAKRWPAAAYAELVDAAQRRWGATPVLLGSSADAPINAAVAAHADTPAVDLSGCSLPDMAAALLRCRVVVSNDSGAAHLAAALGRPTVVAFGPTDAARFQPIGAHVAASAAGSFCRPCSYHVCPWDHRCMVELSPAAVLEAAAPGWQAVV